MTIRLGEPDMHQCCFGEVLPGPLLGLCPGWERTKASSDPAACPVFGNHVSWREGCSRPPCRVPLASRACVG